jgi:glycerol-3-phosphate acyltransferase PlsY
MPHLITLIISYAIGGIPCGFLIGKFNHIDIRSYGSGNIGATNILRVCGKKWGYFCFLLDALKGFAPVLTAKNLLISEGLRYSEYVPIIAVVGVVMGHVWSPYLGFKGGKGVATSAGALLAVSPGATLLALFIWYLVYKCSRYVSLASISAAVALPVAAIFINPLTKGTIYYQEKPILVFLVCLSVLVIFNHKENIQRLLNGTERKFIKKRAENDEHCSVE